MISIDVMASFTKEANFLAKAQSFARSVAGGGARAARAEANTAKASLARAVKTWNPKIQGIHTPGNPAGKTLADRIPHFVPPVSPQLQEQGRRTVAREAAGFGKAHAKAQQAAKETSKARRNLALGAAGTTAAGIGGIVGVTGLKRHLNSQKAIAPQQPKVAAAMNEAARKRKAHQYYVQNREQLLRKKQVYRARNQATIRRSQKRYRREIKFGRKKRRRISMGGHSAMYGGYV